MEPLAERIIILQNRVYNAKDSIITALSENSGKLCLINFNAKSARNRHTGSLQPFCTVSIHATRSKRGLPSINQSDIAQPRRILREDLDRMQYACIITELIDSLFHEHDGNKELFDFLSMALDIICTRNPRITALVAALRIAALAGFKPWFSNCVNCGKKISGSAHFDLGNGGVVCACCNPSGQSGESFHAIALLEKLGSVDFGNPQPFAVNGRLLDCAEKLVYSFIACHTGRTFNSLSFLDAVNPRSLSPV